MKKTTFLKTLLMAVGLCMGGSAWGAVTWDFTNSSVWGSVDLPTEGNSYADCSYNASGEATTEGNYITFHSSTGKIVHGTGTNGIGFDAVGSTSDHYIKMSVPAGSTVTITAYVSDNRNIQVNFNSSNTTFSGNWVNVSKDFINSSENPLDLYIYCSANSGGASSAPYLRSISLKQTVPVTINYRDKDDQANTLISSTVVNVEVGTSFTPTYADPLYVNDTDPYEYTYDSGVSTTTITEATTFNILYTKADRAQYNYTVNAIKNEDKAIIKELASGTLYKGASVKVPYPACFCVNGTYYTRGTTSSEYRQSVTPTKNNHVITFPYIAQSTTNVVYLSEGEDIEGTTKNTTSTNVGVRASNAAAASIPSGGVNICTLPAGTYTLNLFMHHTRNNASVTTTFGYGETEFTVITTGTNRVAAAAKEFTLTETSTLVCKGISGDGLLDNLYITGSVTVSKTITAAGWATYCSPYALDFSDEITNLTDAYIVTGGIPGVTDKGVLVKTSVIGGTVPANTGLLLKGEGACTIPVVANSSTDVSGNKLVGVTSNTEIAAKAAYVLMNDATNGLAFYLNSNAFTVGANTAYLPAGFDGGSARALFFSFGDETTSINDVRSKMSDERADFFNLQGQRVEKPVKGLFIKGGKKVIIK